MGMPAVAQAELQPEKRRSRRAGLLAETLGRGVRSEAAESFDGLASSSTGGTSGTTPRGLLFAPSLGQMARVHRLVGGKSDCYELSAGTRAELRHRVADMGAYGLGRDV